MEKPSTARIALKWGLIISIANIVYSTIINMSGLWKNSMLGMIGFLILIGGIVLALREFKTNNNGFMDFGEGFGLGTLMSTIVGMLGSAFSLIYTKFIDTTMMEQIKDFQVEKMEAQGLTDEQIEQALEMGAKFSSPGMVFIIGVIMYLVLGAIFSLVISAIMRKSKPVFDV